MQRTPGVVMRKGCLLGLLLLAVPSAALAAPPAPTGARVAPATTVHAAVPPRVAPAPSVRIAPATTTHVTPAPPPGGAPRPAATIHLAPTSPVATVHITPPPVATVHVTPAAVAASKPLTVPEFAAPPAGADRAALIAAGKALIKRQATRAQHAVATTGFSSVEDVGKAVAAMGPHRAKAVELLKGDDKLEFTMRVHEDVRDSIAARGFLNQHDTKTSRGRLAPDLRATVEASFLGIPRAEYDKLPNSIRPKYGYLRPAASTGVHVRENAGHYGADVFVFKRDAIKDEVTFYPTDSLGHSPGGLYGSSGISSPVIPAQWDHVMHPWSDRMLLAAGLQVSDANELQFSFEHPAGFAHGSGKFRSYLEIQIWRPLGIEDAERFEFATMPPSGEFLKALRQNGVKIIKQGATEEWKGDQGPTSLRWFLRTSPCDETVPFAKAA